MTFLAETTSTNYHLENGILVSVLKPNHILNMQDAVENMEARESLTLNYPLPALMDIRALSDASFEAIFASTNPRDADHFSAAALLMSTTIHEVISREGKHIRTSGVTTKAFHDRDEAMAWLTTFK